MSEPLKYEPKVVSSPWETAIDWAEENGEVKCIEVWRECLRDDVKICEVLAGMLALTIGNHHSFWDNRERQYREWKESQHE